MSTTEVVELRGRMEDLADKLADLTAKFAEHHAREDEWQRLTAEKLDAHLAEHKALRERWVGLVFTVIGAAVLGVASWAAGVFGIHFGRR